MRAVFQREALREAVTILGGAVPGSDAKPVLQNMKVVVATDGCTLETTNLELGVRVELKSVKAESTGEALVPVARLSAILRELTDDECMIDADKDSVTINAGSTEFEMASDNVDQFPSIAEFDADDYHVMKAGDLRLMINRTQFAAASENPRYAMNGVLWEFEKDLVRLVATDGRRLSVCRGRVANVGGAKDTGHCTHIVPRTAVGLLAKTLNDPDEEVKIILRPNEALFQTPRAMIYTRLVEGRYPAWKEVLPKRSSTTLKIQAGTINSAVRQAAIMSDDESKAMELKIVKSTMTLACKGGGTGRSKVEVGVEKEGKDITIKFDPQFLTAMFRVVDDDTELKVSLEANQPGMIQAGADYDYVVMPLM